MTLEQVVEEQNGWGTWRVFRHAKQYIEEKDEFFTNYYKELGRPLNYGDLLDSKEHRHLMVAAGVALDKTWPEDYTPMLERWGVPRGLPNVMGGIMGLSGIIIGPAVGWFSYKLFGGDTGSVKETANFFGQTYDTWKLWSSLLVGPLRSYNAYLHDRALVPLSGETAFIGNSIRGAMKIGQLLQLRTGEESGLRWYDTMKKPLTERIRNGSSD